MKTAVLAGNAITSAAEVLRELAPHDVLLPNAVATESYLAQHPSLASLLPDICKTIRASFGPAAELVMKVYEDPEIDDPYLTLYIRQDRYAPDLLGRIDATIGEFAAALESASGFFLVTTDFRRSGENHVV
jgi:hypothetical protein